MSGDGVDEWIGDEWMGRCLTVYVSWFHLHGSTPSLFDASPPQHVLPKIFSPTLSPEDFLPSIVHDADRSGDVLV